MAPAFTMTLENGQKISLATGESITFGDFDEIPILDLEKIFSDQLEHRKEVASELYEYCSKVGFFYVKNHNIPQDTIDSAFSIAKEFFDLPDDEKMKVFTGLVPAEEYTGYHPLAKYNRGGRKFNDLSEAFNWNYDPDFDPITPPKSKADLHFNNMWPEELPEMKQVLMNYHTQCLMLARKLIRIVALAFGLSEDYFDNAVQAPSAGMRILHYPVQEHNSDEQNGIGPHTDFQVLTFVNPGAVSGLQVINKAGRWIEAPPIEGTLIVNVGDCLMRITNDKFVSTVHRVVNTSGKVRYSIPFFFGFDYEYMLKPLAGCVDEEHPNKYEIWTSAQYVKWRAKIAKSNNKEIAA